MSRGGPIHPVGQNDVLNKQRGDGRLLEEDRGTQRGVRYSEKKRLLSVLLLNS